MKKILFLITLFFATSMWATTYTPLPGTNTIKAVYDGGLVDGDSIVLATGTYTEWTALEFTTKITLIAAPDAKPVLHWYCIKIKNDFEVNGIEMINYSKDNYLLRTSANVAGKISVKNCSFQLNAAVTSVKTFIYLSSNSIGTLEIDNCIFKDNATALGAIITGGDATVTNFTMTNSTAYNCPGDIAVNLQNLTNGTVDQCTFYNCGTRTIYFKGGTNYLAKNCILSTPTTVSNTGIRMYGGNVYNCIYNNQNAPSSDNATVTGCQKADPLFVDAANANFQLEASSPAINFGTEGQTIGDPRWGVAARDPKIEVEPGTSKLSAALASAQAGDTLILKTGTYTENSAVTVDKQITILAAEGAEPKMYIAKILTNAAFEINGIDVSLNGGDYLFRTTAGGDFSVVFRNCVLHDCKTIFYYISSGQSINSLVIDNCIFRDNVGTTYDASVVYGYGTIGTFSMSNSTIYNISGKYAIRVKNSTNATVDHCTFYNCGKSPIIIGETTKTNIAISNTVISNPALVEGEAFVPYAGTVSNSVWFNTADGVNWQATKVNVVNADPQFVDAANGDFNFPVTSPLFFAATDGTHIGDPRWTAQIGAGIDLPAVLNKANVSTTHKDMTYYETDYFDFGPNDSSNDTLLWAMWTVNITKGKYEVVADLSCTSGYKLQLEFINPATGQVVKTVLGKSKDPNLGSIDLNDLDAGQYMLRLKNRTGWSKVKVKSITFTQKGGKVVDVPATLVGDEDYVMLSQYAAVINDTIFFATDDKEWLVDDGWAKWNIKVAEKANYSIKALTCVPMGIAGNGWNYKVAIIDGTDTIYSKAVKGASNGDTIVDLVSCVLEPGTYTLQMQNIKEYSKGRLLSVAVEKVLTAYPRTIAAGRWGTICYPNQIQTIERATLYEPVDKSETALTVDPVSLTDVVAGKAYFFYAEEADPVFYYNDQITPAGDSIENNGLIGTFTGIELSEQKWVLTNNVIKPAAVGSTVGAYRAYVDLEKVEKTSAPARAGRKVFNIADAPTELENVNANVNANRKLLINGQFVIVKDGKRFNAQGTRL